MNNNNFSSDTEDKVKNPLVSICVLTYNHEKYIRQALDSFLCQKTDFEYEIVIHDDASADATAEIIREYERKYPMLIRPMLQTENQYSKGIINVSGTYNFPRARGKYFAFCDGDDFWNDEYKLQKQVDFLEQHPECGLCFHAVNDVNERGEFMRVNHVYKQDRALTSGDIITAAHVYPFVSFMFRRECVEELPKFYFDSPVGDLPVQLLCAAYGGAGYIDAPMASYRRMSAGSWTSQMWSGNYHTRLEKYIADIQGIYRAFDEYTHGKFHAEVETSLKRLEFELHAGKEEFRIIIKKEYRPFFKTLPFRARLGAYIGAVNKNLFYMLKPKQ